MDGVSSLIKSKEGDTMLNLSEKKNLMDIKEQCDKQYSKMRQ
jgi:hypothetical protein